MPQNKLWTKNFTIITLGTVISMLGNAVSGFSIGLLVLDYTDSLFLYTLFLVAYSLPKIVMPLFSGPFLDNFSRAKVVYTLDFISAGIFTVIFLLLHNKIFSYLPFLIITFIIGSIDSVYMVAYDSLYPTLVSKENYSKAYSISSIIYPLSTVMVPVAAFVYQSLGDLSPLFAFNALTFLIAAIFETGIKADESHIRKSEKKFSLADYSADFRSGLNYIRSEKGLMVITAYFFITMFADASTPLSLPFFKSDPSLGVLSFTWVMAFGIIGRLAGGLIHYKIKLPSKYKFQIAIVVYIVITIISGVYLFAAKWLMMILMFISGFLSVNSYNIRISATQSYVPNEYRGRFNGTFQMLLALGSIAGQLVSGALADGIGPRPVTVAFYAVNLVAVFTVMYAGKKHVIPIYNAEQDIKKEDPAEAAGLRPQDPPDPR